MPVSDAVGLHVPEAMRGEVTRASTGTVESLAFSTLQVIDSLNAFVDGDQHVCRVEGGTVTWRDGPFPRTFSITGGSIEMFRLTHPPSRKQKEFEFRIEFKGPGGAPFLLHGFKDLLADGPVQPLDAMGDLSTLKRVRVIDLSRPDEAVATGMLRVHLEDLFGQVSSMRFPGTQSQLERDHAQQKFMAFMNGELADVYAVLPLLFRESRSLVWHQHLLIAFLLEVFIPGPKAATPAEVIEQLEQYLANSSLSFAGLLDAVAGPLRLVGGNLAQLDPMAVRALVRDVLETPVTNVLQKVARDAMKSMHQLLVAAYYACPSVDASIGYTRVTTSSGPWSTPLRMTPRPVGQYDVVIAGSGVAGSLLAHRLTRAGKRVCLLESGRYLPESSFTSAELEGLSRSYMGGGLQTALDVGRPVEPPHLHNDLTVLQARAVGGGGLVNNTVCFRLPKPTFDRWRNAGFPIDEAALNRAYDAVAVELGIKPLRDALTPGARLNPAVRFIESSWGPVKQHPPALPNVPGLYECNVNMKQQACRGCGLCNVGCSYEAKQNSLQLHLREALATGQLDVVPLARAQRFLLDGSKVTGVEVLLNGTETMVVKGKQYVSACGPIHSSGLLKRSRVKDARVGTRLSANIGAPVLAFFDEPVDSFGSVQISHFYWPDEPGPRFVIESWFNSPAAHAMVVPGFLERHEARMKRYRYVAVLAPLVGTLAMSRVGDDGRLQLTVGRDELAKVHQGHGVIARALMDDDNPLRLTELVMPTRHGFVVNDASSLAAYEFGFSDWRDLVVGTGHPQGGNPMSVDPRLDVVGPDFRLKGYDNLRVCDGSLFPDCANINPQWTIMALAHLCGEQLAAV